MGSVEAEDQDGGHQTGEDTPAAYVEELDELAAPRGGLPARLTKARDLEQSQSYADPDQD
jgi:hypothetical protein